MRAPALIAKNFWALVGSAIQPTTIITFFGPLILHSNLTILRGNLFVKGTEENLILALENRWTIAISEWEIQLYTFIIAFVILLAHVVFAWLILVKNGLSNQAKAYMSHDLFTISAVFSLIACIVLFALICVAGISAKEAVIAMYLPPEENIRGSEFALPPLYSPITWGRGAVLTSGILLFWAIRKHQRRFPGVINTGGTANTLLETTTKK